MAMAEGTIEPNTNNRDNSTQSEARKHEPLAAPRARRPRARKPPLELEVGGEAKVCLRLVGEWLL
jgi:hypothetical protein